MPDREDGAPFIARCTFQQPYRGGAWQCRLTDPHEGVDHDLPVDAEFGRDLDVQDPLWLAAKLRDERARNRHLKRMIKAVLALAGELDESDLQRDAGSEVADRIRGALGVSRG